MAIKGLVQSREVDYGTWIITIEEYDNGTWVGVLYAVGQTLSTPPYKSREEAHTDAYELFKELKN